MNDQKPDIVDIPINAITILNPRSRNRRQFQELVTSIAHLGLKRPITVAARAEGGYNLICGQGRLEACRSLGAASIAAVVVEASDTDCFVMSLVENMARCQHSPLEFIREIEALRKRGYSNAEIAAKTDFTEVYVKVLGYLLDHGESRLMIAMEKGIIPPTIAVEIARARDAEVQQALADAYEQKALPGNQVLAIRRIIERRRTAGKGGNRAKGNASQPPSTPKVTAAKLVRAYQVETDRQRRLVKQADLTQSRFLFIVNALGRLLTDRTFVDLLCQEALDELPRPLLERLDRAGSNA